MFWDQSVPSTGGEACLFDRWSCAQPCLSSLLLGLSSHPIYSVSLAGCFLRAGQNFFLTSQWGYFSTTLHCNSVGCEIGLGRGCISVWAGILKTTSQQFGEHWSATTFGAEESRRISTSVAWLMVGMLTASLGNVLAVPPFRLHDPRNGSLGQSLLLSWPGLAWPGMSCLLMAQAGGWGLPTRP